jgi:hypothetical protein
MTSFRKLEANRRNALKSTGPTTLAGKNRSRRNAVRHGLTSETVITTIEDSEDYRAFESAIVADHDVTTAVERELVLRVASLLWRLRRATSIETGLFQARAELLVGDHQILQPAFGQHVSETTACTQSPQQHEITQRFLCLTKADSVALERINRYEAVLWRQLRQTLFTLQLLCWQRRQLPLTRSKHAWWKSFDPSDK